jgi:hypothetical protein
MKILALVIPIVFLMSAPALSAEYQGRNIDGKKLAAKAYYYATGGVYDVQVLFNQRRATIYFPEGNQITIQLKQQVITDPTNIQGFGKPGYFPLDNTFSIGLESNNDSDGQPPADPLEGFWRLSLK